MRKFGEKLSKFNNGMKVFVDATTEARAMRKAEKKHPGYEATKAWGVKK